MSKKIVAITCAVLLIGTASFFLYQKLTFAVSATKTLTTQADWEAGEYYPGSLDTKTTAGNLQIKSGSVGAWNPGTPGFTYDNAGYDYWTYDGNSYGAGMATDGTYIYQIVGGRRPYLFRFNPETNTWKQLANAPTAFYYGAAITYDAYSKALFAIDGGDSTEATNVNNATKHLFKYDIATDTWSRIPTDAPDIWTLGSVITSDGTGKLYAMRAYVSAALPDAFWSYNQATGVWNDTLPMPTQNFSSTNGQSLLFVNEPYPAGSPTSCTLGCVFALGGGATANFFREDIAENQWYSTVTGMGNAGYGSSLSYDSVNGDIFVHNGGTGAVFSKYDVSAATWDATREDTQQLAVSYGGSAVYIKINNVGYIYQTRGYATPDMWRYSISNNQWESVATPTTTFTAGAGGEDGLIVYVATGVNQCLDASGCLFVFRGANTATFWRYNIGARTWTTNLTATNLGAIYYGGSACKAGNTLYALRGNNTRNFYSYDLTAADPGSVWTALTDIPAAHTHASAYPANPTAATVGYGGSITCLGSTVYAVKGYQTYYSNHFFSYTGGAWSQQTPAPQRMGPGGAIVGVDNGASCADATGCIFALMGYNRGDWYRYNISATTWTQLTDIPTATNYTASLTYDGSGNIYAISGDYDTKMWRYNIAGNSWTRIADLPGKAGYSNGLAYDTAANIIYALNGMGTGQIWKFTPTANDYISTSTWISDIQDLNYVTAWEQLSSTLTTGGTSNVDLAMRSSPDKITWSTWETLVTGGTGPAITQDISSAATNEDRYIQFKITLNSDGTNTPNIDSVTVTYTKDSTAPVNPTATGYSSSAKSLPALTNNFADGYYHTNPYFELSGSTDTNGSGVAGYYLAWTTDPNFNPASSEDYYQTGTTYRVNTNMVTASPGPTYYLRVAAKDNAGNPATAATAFTYTYTGIASASTYVWDDSAEFNLGTETNVNTTANSSADMTLDSVSPGTWMDLPAIGSNNSLTGYTGYNDSSIAWDGNDTIYFLRSVNSQTFLKYTISTKTWAALANTGAAAQYGSAIVYVAPGVSAGCADAQGCIFATMGGAGTGFRRYNIGANTWDAMTVVSGTVGYGAGLVYTGGDYIYATRGAGNLDFYRYTISTNTWTGRASVEFGFNYGAAYSYVSTGTYCADVSGCIFATRGAGTNHFWRYDISENSWSYLTAPPTASPAKGNYGATMVYNGGILYFIAGYAATDFLKYDIANDLWSDLADLPATHYYGSTNGMVFDTSTNTIYTPRMYNEYSFISYDVTNNKWRNPAIPHGQSSNGFYYGGMAFDGADTMYVARGNNTNDFYKYTISTQVWQRLNNVPIRMYTGSDLLYINGTVYALGGAPSNAEGVSRFFSYNPATDIWTRLNNTPGTVTYGTDLIWDGSNTIYTARGSNTTTFYSYSISGGTWATQASVIPGAVQEGGCAVIDGTNSYIYLIRSTNTRNIYRCTINQGAGTCTWSAAGTLTDSPLAQGNLYYGGACALDGDNIFVPQGNTTNTNFLVYSILGNSWTVRSLNNFYYHGRLLEGLNNILYGFRGYNTSTMDRYVQQSATTSFQRIGTWTSQIMDLGSVYGFGGLIVNDSLGAANTAMKYETRACSDAGCAADANDAHWSAWSETSAKKTVGTTDYFSLDSAVARYLQVKVTFTSDRIYTPTVNDFTLSYYVDGTAPNNPSVPVTGYTDSGKGTGITNDIWTNDATPYFEWTSTDNTGGIGVNGYYVYFGTDISKDPVSDASDATNLAYKTGTNYYSAASSGMGSWNVLTQSASALTDGTYYLRIKTKDHNNNTTAAAVDAFTYKIDVSAPNTITDLSVAIYMLSADTFSFSWTEPADIGPSTVAQYCYHTGSSADTCVAKATICSSGTCTVSPVAHYQTRANTFYVRAKDTANNDATTYASTNYFYTGGPPATPASVTVTPGSQTDTNSFTVSWALPGSCLGATPCAAADVLRYCYTINELPSLATCGTNYSGNATPSPDGGWTTELQTSSRQLPTFSAASQQGINTVYVVAMDVVNNINYENYTSQAFTFTSNAPGPPADLGATDSSDRAATRSSITLTWDAPTNLGSGVEAYKVYRCTTDCENPSTTDDPPANYTSIAEVNTLGYLDTSLSNATTYSFFVRVTGTGGTISGNSTVVSMKPEGKFKAAPAMSGNPTASIRIRSAEISWLTQDDVDKNGDPVSHPASSYVQYGTTTGYGGETGSSDLVKEHEVSLTNLSPNTLYHYRLKWVDVDGNIGLSSDYSFTTLGAPSAPTGVTATPTSGTTNSFAFSWTKPADEGVTVASYRYSVNSTPTADNTTLTTATSVAAFAAATRQGSNTFYVVAIDDSGNVNYANYGSVDFTAYTAPPDPPKNITLVDSSNRDAKRYSLTLTWDPPTVSAAGSAVRAQAVDGNMTYYTIYRSTDGTNFSEIATITSTGYLDTGLDNTQTYTYKVIAKDKAQASSAETVKLAAIPQGRFTSPPAISQEPVIAPDSFAATVAWKTERVASSFVEFGTNKEKLNNEQGKAEQVEDHNIKITGLKPETVYYHRIKSLDIDQNTAYSEISSFTTLEAPRVENVKVTDVRLNDAIISWTSTKESTAVIEYGPTTDYGFTYTAASGFSTSHTVKLENLKDGTTYHFRLEGVDRSDNPIASDDYNFTTLTYPKVLTVTSANKAEGQTEVKWTTNVSTTSEVEYWNDKSPNKTQGNSSLVTQHSILVFGLEDATEYKFKVRGRDQFGYEAVSGENKFRTLEDTTPPVISEVKSESNTVGSGDAAKIQIIVSWKTNEPTTSRVQYGEGLSGSSYSAESDENAERVREHLMVIGGLTPAKTYHFRVVSRDKAGNESKSQGYSILTSRARQSFLQIVIGNLEDTFSWLGSVNKLFGK
ncbi:MAG: fibronectin type III domain-containing protein [Patescibacteria group bacterium]